MSTLRIKVGVFLNLSFLNSITDIIPVISYIIVKLGS
jgi:hypothetical protein